MRLEVVVENSVNWGHVDLLLWLFFLFLLRLEGLIKVGFVDKLSLLVLNLLLWRGLLLGWRSWRLLFWLWWLWILPLVFGWPVTCAILLKDVIERSFLLVVLNDVFK